MIYGIVVPIDFSIYSENAFISALRIATKSKTRLICINVVNTLRDWQKLSVAERAKHPHIGQEVAEANEMLEAFVLNHNIKDVKVETVVKTGVPSEEIVSYAAKIDADLIVIGAYGKGREEGKFIGSNIQKVLRHAACPILAVKKPMKAIEFNKMAFASLFNEATRPAFLRMRPLIQGMEAAVHFLHIITSTTFKSSSKPEELMRKYAMGLDDMVIHHHVYNHDEVEEGIISFCESNKIGWLGIVSNNRRSSKSYQIGITETVLFKSDIPVLSVKLE